MPLAKSSDCKHDDERPQNSEQGRGRPLAPVGGRARVVADEPVAGAPDFSRDRRDEEHADKHVKIEERPDTQDRYSLRRQQDE